MAFLSEAFVAADMPVSEQSFDPLPAGWYSASISGAELKKTKAGSGEYIAMKLAITGPTHQGRVVFSNVNIKNQSDIAQQIGRQQLGEIMRAIGLARVSDTDQLIGGQLSIKLSIKEDEKYGTSNEVKGYKAIAGSVPPKPVSGVPASKTASPPWSKK